MIASWNRPDGVSLRLLLIRHGEPEASARGRCYGKLDVGLSANGHAQMARLGEALESASIDAFYASPRRRALESVERLGGKPIVEPRLAEINFGELEGLTYDEAAERYPRIYEEWMRAPTEVHFPGGESFTDMRQRVLEVVSEIREARKEQTVAIVSHGGVNRIVLAKALGIESRAIFRMEQSYAGMSVIDEYDEYELGGDCIVRVLNAQC
ncbi:MAG: histidine phosphatase family protein [Acidobacteria bacterium]|nr:MAG: histidine phosphatase family protein [Acidobacteriota bacterium]